MVNEIKNELDEIENKIHRIESYQNYHINEMNKYKLKKKGNIIALIVADCTLPVIFASFGHIGPAISAFISATTYATINYIVESRKEKIAQRRSKEAQKQLDYLNETKTEIENEIEKSKRNNNSIKIDYINKKYNWRNRIRLMNIYDIERKKYLKLYKKGELKETLKKGYSYDEEDALYLYERVQNEYNNKKRILKKTFGDCEY